MIPDRDFIWVSFFLAQRPAKPISHPIPGVILLSAMRQFRIYHKRVAPLLE